MPELFAWKAMLLTTDTLQNQRAHAQINCDQTVVLSQQKLLRNGRLFTAVGMGSSPTEHNYKFNNTYKNTFNTATDIKV